MVLTAPRRMVRHHATEALARWHPQSASVASLRPFTIKSERCSRSSEYASKGSEAGIAGHHRALRYLLALAATISRLEALKSRSGNPGRPAVRWHAHAKACFEEPSSGKGGNRRRCRDNLMPGACERASRNIGVRAPVSHRSVSGESVSCDSGSVSPPGCGPGTAWCARPAARGGSARPPAGGTIARSKSPTTGTGSCPPSGAEAGSSSR